MSDTSSAKVWMPLLVLVVMMLLVLLCKVIKIVRSSDSATLCHTLSSLIGVGSIGTKGASSDLMEHVMQGLNARRIEWATTVATVLWPVCLALSAIFTVRLMLDVSHHLVETVILVTITMLLTLAHMLPKIFLTSLGLCCLHLVLMVLLSAMVCFEADFPQTLVLQSVRHMVVLLCGGLYLWFPVIFATNLIFTTCDLVSKAVNDSSSDMMLLHWDALASFVATLVVLFCLEAIALQSAKKEVEQRCEKCELSAVTSLLDMMCDALVHLDSDLNMKDHCTKLAVILMHGATQSLQGKSFSSFVYGSEDALRFGTLTTQTSAEANALLARSLSTFSLRDAIGNCVKVSIFHVPYSSIGGQVHHMLGIREESGNGESRLGNGYKPMFDPLDQDSGRGGPRVPDAVLRPDFARVLGRVDCEVQPAEGTGTAPTPSRRRSASDAHSSGSSSGHTSLAGGVDSPDPAMSVNVFLERSLPIHAIAPRLQRRLGVRISECPQLSSFMPDGGTRLFTRALDVIDDMSRNAGPDAYLIDLGHFDMFTKNKRGILEQSTRKIWLDFVVGDESYEVVPDNDARPQTNENMPDSELAPGRGVTFIIGHGVGAPVPAMGACALSARHPAPAGLTTL